MTVTTAPTASTSATTGTDSRTTPLWRTAARAGVLAATATTAVAAGALAAGVPLEVDGEQIPLAGFAQLTLMCTVVGLLLAKALSRWVGRPQRTFTVAAVALSGCPSSPTWPSLPRPPRRWSSWPPTSWPPSS